MTTVRFCSALLALVVFPFQTSLAQIQLVGQDRRANSSVLVTGDGESDFDQLSEVAPDSGPFIVSLFTDAVIPTASASATAEQNSEITAVSVRADGLATGEAQAGANATAYAAAQSNVAVRFTLDVATPYTIHGFVDATQNGTATLQLSRPFQTIAWYSGDGGQTNVHQQGTLDPGTYDLNITCGVSAAVSLDEPPAQESASYDILLALASGTAAPLAAAGGETLRAWPNPFRAATRLSVPEGVREVHILDAAGRRVRTLTGSGDLVFDGTDASGRPLSSGVYWMKAIGGRELEAVKVVRLQ